MTSPPLNPPRWLLPLALALPLLCGFRIWFAGDSLLTPYNFFDFHAALTHANYLRSSDPSQSMWMDWSLLGGFPSFAAGAPFYPGQLLLWLLPPLAGWNWLLLLHLAWATGLTARWVYRTTADLPLTCAAMAVVGGSLDAFFLMHFPFLLLLLPWLLWTLMVEARGERPPLATALSWSGTALIATTLGLPAMLLTLAIGLLASIWFRRGALLGGMVLGLGVGATQWIPALTQPGLFAVGDLGPALLAVLHPVALLPFCAWLHRQRDGVPWWLVLLIPIVVFYPWTWPIGGSIVISLATLIPLSRHPAIARWHGWAIVGLLLAPAFFGPATVSLPYQSLREYVGVTRGLFPGPSHPSVGVLHPLPAAPAIVSTYGRPATFTDWSRARTGPLLWNLGPDPGLGAASVALPTTPAWRELLAYLDALHQKQEQTRVGDVIAFEYFAETLGLSALISDYPNYQFLDYSPLDGAHPATSQAAATRDSLEQQLLEQFATAPEAGLPERAPPFVQEPVAGRYFYRALGNLPWAVFLHAPDRPIQLPAHPLAEGQPASHPANWGGLPPIGYTWTGMLQDALLLLQKNTDYPFQISRADRLRYAVLTPPTQGGPLVLEDRGLALETPPTRRDQPGGLTLHFQVPESAAPWILLRITYFPGWSATVNDNPVALVPADGPWMALPLTPGSANDCVLTFQNPGHHLARQVQGVALLLLVGLGALWLPRSGVLSSPGAESHTPDSPAAPPRHPGPKS